MIIKTTSGTYQIAIMYIYQYKNRQCNQPVCIHSNMYTFQKHTANKLARVNIDVEPVF